MVDWQEQSFPIKEAAKQIITGVQTLGNQPKDFQRQHAQTLIEGIRNGEVFENPIYRGISIMDMSSPILQLKTGDSFQITDIGSFTKHFQIARNFSVGPKQGDIHVVFQTDGPVKGLDIDKIDPHSASIGYGEELEVITDGMFQVTGVEDQQGYGTNVYHTIHIKQLGTF